MLKNELRLTGSDLPGTCQFFPGVLLGKSWLPCRRTSFVFSSLKFESVCVLVTSCSASDVQKASPNVIRLSKYRFDLEETVVI